MSSKENPITVPGFDLWVEREMPWRSSPIRVNRTGLTVAEAEKLRSALGEVIQEARCPPLKKGDIINPKIAPEPPRGTILRNLASSQFVIGRDSDGWWTCDGQTNLSWDKFILPYKVVEVGDDS